MTFYIRANRCGSLNDDIFALSGCKREELGGIEFELNSIPRMTLDNTDNL